MNIRSRAKEEIKVCDANRASAYGVLLSRPNVVGIYPITPQTSLIEYLSQFKANGLFGGEIVLVEGEISAMGVAIGTSLAGGRTFTASSSMGLNFMYDTYGMASLMRLPVVMVNANREQHPSAVASGQQDIMGVADQGWIHVHTEGCQEVLDSIIMAYRLAEDLQVLLPVTVCYDGFYLSYLAEPIVIPPQEDVDNFLPKVPRPRLGLDPAMSAASTMIASEVAEARYRHQAALERAKQKIDEVDQEFASIFGRSYGGLLEEYRMDDAEIAILSMGSHTGTARVVVDMKREQGYRVGLIKLRVFRPFPWERLIEALKNIKAIGIIDRSVCFGWNCGHLFHELEASFNRTGFSIPMLNFIGGLGGEDITISHIERAVELTYAAFKGKPVNRITWLAIE